MRKFGFLFLLLFSFSLTNANDSIFNYVENYADLAVNMIYVKGGTFEMGNKKDSKREHDEENVHEATLSDFYIGKTEISVAQFAKFVDETNYVTNAEQRGGDYIWDSENAVMKFQKGANWRCDEYGSLLDSTDYVYFPVIYISWNDANEFCKWLSAKTKKNYSLPTEAEWEYAARGGNSKKRYVYSGSNKAEKVAWYSESTEMRMCPMAYKEPNQLGIYDMSGGVYEWCSDWYEDKYPTESQVNPTGPENKHNKLFRRVIRGGSWIVYKEFCRVTNRDSGDPNAGTSTGGFRIVCRNK